MSDTPLSNRAGHHVIVSGSDGLPINPDGPSAVVSRDSHGRSSSTRDVPSEAGAEVPAGSRDVIAWIKEPSDPDVAAERARLAMEVERTRGDGVRKTVADAAAEALDPAPSDDDGADE